MENTSAILTRMQIWCGRQERCSHEVRTKLKKLGHSPEVQDEVITQLIEENYLSDERFAVSYAEGKSRLKKWGPMKIRSGLQLKRIPSELVNMALSRLEHDELHDTMVSLLEQRWPYIKGKNLWERKSKAVKFLMGKGYTYGAAMKALEAWSEERDE